MARYIEAQFNPSRFEVIPASWQPDFTNKREHCESKQRAEHLESIYSYNHSARPLNTREYYEQCLS